MSGEPKRHPRGGMFFEDFEVGRTYEHRYVWCLWETERVTVTATRLAWLSTAAFTDVAVAKRNAQLKKGNLK